MLWFEAIGWTTSHWSRPRCWEHWRSVPRSWKCQSRLRCRAWWSWDIHFFRQENTLSCATKMWMICGDPMVEYEVFFHVFSIFWMFLCLPERCRATKSSFSFWVDNFACFRMRPSFDLWSSTSLFWQLQYISEPMEPMSLFWPIPLSACLSAK
jgi:hypothetical protein